MAIYGDEYYAFLERVQNNYVTTVREIPLDEPRININLNTRKIEIEKSEYSDFLSMVRDHRAETVYFEVDRYYEDIDLFNCSCIVEYINANKQARIYPITLKDTNSLKEQNKMILAWNIGNEATASSGQIQFSILFYKINLNNKTFSYALHTSPAYGNILHGMIYDNEELQKEEQDTYYTLDATSGTDVYRQLVDMINQKNVYWHDL